MALTQQQIIVLAAAALRLAADVIDGSDRRPNIGMALTRVDGAQLYAASGPDRIRCGGAFAQAKRDALTVLADHLGLDTSSGTLTAVNAWSHATSRREVTAAMRDAAAEHETGDR